MLSLLLRLFCSGRGLDVDYDYDDDDDDEDAGAVEYHCCVCRGAKLVKLAAASFCPGRKLKVSEHDDDDDKSSAEKKCHSMLLGAELNERAAATFSS